ncbi:MAG: HEAT repeat domain-containing protein [bacterium]
MRDQRQKHKDHHQESDLSQDDRDDLFRDLSSADPKRRRYAVRILAGKTNSLQVSSFLDKLRPYDWEGRLSAISLLEHLGDETAADKLKTLVLDFHPRVRGAARKSLKKLGVQNPYSEDEVLELVSYLDHPSWWVKISVIKSLAMLKDRRAVDSISRLLLDEDEQVREAARDAITSLRKSPR